MIKINHCYLELFDCNAEKLSGKKSLNALVKIAEKMEAHIIDSSYNKIKQGYSYYVALKESHIGILTFPELNYAYVDMLTCGDMNLEEAIEPLKQYFEAKKSAFMRFPQVRNPSL